MKLIDNVNNRLGDDLKAGIKKGSKLSIAASSFSIYAYEALKKELEKIDELRFVFSSPTFMEENFKKDVPKFFIPHLYKEAELCGGEFELRLKKNMATAEIAAKLRLAEVTIRRRFSAGVRELREKQGLQKKWTELKLFMRH